jgi:hypothetical protein
MRRPSRRMNFIIEEAICKDLEHLVPPGKRSRVVNEALRKELEYISRKNAVEKLIGSSSSISKLSTREIVEELTQERGGH